jgi:hypothetical protein
MPVGLRNYTFGEIKNYYEEKNKEYEKLQGKSSTTTVMDSSGKVTSPNFLQSKRTSYK